MEEPISSNSSFQMNDDDDDDDNLLEEMPEVRLFPTSNLNSSMSVADSSSDSNDGDDNNTSPSVTSEESGKDDEKDSIEPDDSGLGADAARNSATVITLECNEKPAPLGNGLESKQTKDDDDCIDLDNNNSSELRNLLNGCHKAKQTITSPPTSALSKTSGSGDKATPKRPSMSIVDSLLDKMRKNSDSSGVESISQFQQQLTSEEDEELLVEIEPPVRYSVPTNPNLMPTPIVHNQRAQTSAFANNEEEYQQGIAKANKNRKLQRPEHDKGRMGSRTELPRMRAPEMISNVPKPRTLAEKRILVNSNNINHVKFLMIEQEGKIFKQIQRKKDNLDLNYSLVDALMNEDIPIKSDPWKALTWLRTMEQNYIHQYINIDNTFVKLAGSRGNHPRKFLPPQTSRPLRKYSKTNLRSIRCCKHGRISKRSYNKLINLPSIQNFVLDMIAPHKRLETKLLDNQLTSIGPRPLSRKVEFMNRNRRLLKSDEDGVFLGDYMKFDMPNIKLKISTKSKAPLDANAKKYLNQILPHRDLDENWINFALSALADSDGENKNNSFEFSIPYQNNKRDILVREINRRKEDNEMLRIVPPFDVDEDDEMEWTFAKAADTTDPVEMEVVEVIKDLSNSTFINLNDDLFTQEDPHIREASTSTISPFKSTEAIKELSSIERPIVRTDNKKKVLAELKRLNANVFKSDSPCVEDQNDMRRHATAHLGRKERELRTTVIVTDSDTVLLGNQETESRRIKRLPKKFDDYMHPAAKTSSLSDDDGPSSSKKAKFEDLYVPDAQYRLKYRNAIPEVAQKEMDAIKTQVKKMLHVSVDVLRLDLRNIEPWCMVHNLYKCTCKGHLTKGDTFEYVQVVEAKQEKAKIIESRLEIIKRKLMAEKNAQQMIREQQQRVWSERESAKRLRQGIKPRIPTDPLLKRVKEKPTLPMPLPQGDSESETDDDMIDEGCSRRVLPVHFDSTRVPKRSLATAVLSDPEGMPKMEIFNLDQLINRGIGPIYINIYDASTNRLNVVLRTILNNKSALIYIEGCAYYIDKKRIDVQKLNFDSIESQLEHPIFILQSKTSCPGPVSSTMTDDFIQLIFHEDTDSFVKISDKQTLREIADMIESILRNVKRKLEAKIGENPSEFVKHQLSMITKEGSRSRSVSDSNSISSVDSSPLHFNGYKLDEAPPPGRDTPLMKEFNRIFSERMQKLCQIIRSNTIGLRPSDEFINKFYIYKWSLLLQSFEEDLVQVWQARMESESGVGYWMLALTEDREPPKIANVEPKNITNVRRMKLSDKMLQLTQLLLLRAENAASQNMTILMYGCKGYMRICGIFNSKDDFLSGLKAKPTQNTHPRLAAKIQKVYHIWHLSKNNRSAQPKKVQEVQRLHSEVKAPIVIEPSIVDQKKRLQSDFKWFLFNITNDFSDIFIKNWRKYLSYEVIMRAIERAKQSNSTVSLVPTMRGQRRWPKMYALSSAPLKFKEHESMTDNFLIFGPYLRNSNSNLLLMQNVNGQLMLRDEYEKKNNIERTTRTRCLWIYANTLKCINDVDPKTSINLTWTSKKNSFLQDKEAASKAGNQDEKEQMIDDDDDDVDDGDVCDLDSGKEEFVAS